MRRRYPVKFFINNRKITEVIIDPHYEIRHGDVMTDKLILELVKKLSGLSYRAEIKDAAGFEYFKTEPLWFEGKAYRMIWLTHVEESYVGVRNAFRTKKWRKK